jgi:hypothetical protein
LHGIFIIARPAANVVQQTQHSRLDASLSIPIDDLLRCSAVIVSVISRSWCFALILCLRIPTGRGRRDVQVRAWSACAAELAAGCKDVLELSDRGTFLEIGIAAKKSNGADDVTGDDA